MPGPCTEFHCEFLGIKVSITTEPDDLRYYSFEKTTKARGYGWCWLCQHSKKYQEETIWTYADTWLNGEAWGIEAFHIEMTQNPNPAEEVFLGAAAQRPRLLWPMVDSWHAENVSGDRRDK